MTAEEANKAETTEQAAAGKKGSGLKLIIIILVLFLVLAGGGIFAYFKFIAPSSTEEVTGETSAKEESLDKAEMLGPTYPLDSFIVNLAESGGKRFLKVTIELELDKEELKDEIEKRTPQVKDTTLTLLSSKSFDDIYVLEGKFRLREELITRLNTILKTGKIRNVFFTEFVIQ